MKKSMLILAMAAIVGFIGCDCPVKNNEEAVELTPKEGAQMDVFAEVELTADISHLSENEKQILKLMFKAADIMDGLFWKEAYGDKEAFLSSIKDEHAKLFANINYGPWDRLENNTPFINGIEAKPKGANFYPADITKEEFEAFDNPDKESQYTLIRRDENGQLKVVWYHEAFKEEIEEAASLLKQAAELADDEGLKNYLTLRSEALLTDKYQPSDMAWMDMKTSNLDFVVGPIENYEDHLFGHKAAHEAFILVKDVEWSNKLSYFTQFLPQLQKELPVEPIYKQETPGSDVDLNAYSVVYYAGDCNAASKTLAINLPNDEEVQLKKGSRKLQLKNALQAKFDKILMPISDVLIAEDQRKHIQFNSFFTNTMFHEIAHGMGIKTVINDSVSVRNALKEQYTALEESKADILGLYMIDQLAQKGEMGEVEIMDNYVTFMAGIFRSIRFGAASSHGKANMIRFNYFLENEAFTRHENGTYSVNFEKMQKASESLTREILEMQGNGDYEVAKAYVEKWAVVKPQLAEDLKRLADANIPKDIYYKQGPEMIGL